MKKPSGKLKGKMFKLYTAVFGQDLAYLEAIFR